MRKNKIFIILFILNLAFFSIAQAALGDASSSPIALVNESYEITIKDSVKLYDVFNKNVSFILSDALASSSGSILVQKIRDNEVVLPWKLEKISPVYQYEFKNFYNTFQGPVKIVAKYEKNTNFLKKFYFYDKNVSSWRPLPSIEDPFKKTITAISYLPFARVAVFSNPDVLVSGKASWYNYKKGLYAASPDFPGGTRLRVYNLENKKSVDVEVNDFGPNRILHPDRVIDLEKTAFKKLASSNSGLANIFVELISLPAKSEKDHAVNQSVASDLKIKAKSAIVFVENTNRVILEKNASSSLPLASLSKIIAIKTFLDTRPDLNKLVTYKVQDENYNYKYVDYKWQSARLKVKDGDILSVEDLIYSALVGSANNAVETLVRVSGLSRDEFIAKMNENVRIWGASSTNFFEPTGLSPKNVSSVLDYAIITKEVFRNPIIEKASAAKEYVFTTRNTKEKHRIRNTNNLLDTSGFLIKGSKTGYLDEAGYCLMTRASIGKSQNIIVVVFGESSKANSTNETAELIKYGAKRI